MADENDNERPPKPCAKLLTHYASPTWCELPDGHEDACSGPQPRALPPGACEVRLVGLRHDKFADMVRKRSRS